jgi:cell wall-associated NlpC family hydrolase
MRRGVLFLVLGVALAALGAASAFAAGTTTTSTTASTTTTTTTPSYAPLGASSLPSSCVGAGAAAIASPLHATVALGTPASDLGPSGYSASSSVVAFASSTASGSTCKGTSVELASVSLFGGAVTADSVVGTDGRGTVAGLKIDGSSVSLTAGQTIAVESWGQLTLGETFGRLSAPLVLELVHAHDSLSAGTRIAVAFAATPRIVKRKTAPSSASNAHNGQKADTSDSHKKAKEASTTEQSRNPPDFPVMPYPFTADGALGRIVEHNPVLSTAIQYLGIPYLWGGSTPTAGFDCSGLVAYVFAQLGVSLPHYTVSQWDSPAAVPVQPNQLRPGDLVFFVGSDGTRQAPGHVGIYVGNGYLIDAPHTGSFVRVDRLTDPRLADGYVGARRIESQLLGTHHLLGVDQADASATALRLGFASRTALVPLSALGVSASSTAAMRHASDNRTMWMGGGFGGLLILLSAGAFVSRRRRSGDSETSN